MEDETASAPDRATEGAETAMQKVELSEGLRKGGDVVNAKMPEVSPRGSLDSAPAVPQAAANADSPAASAGSEGQTTGDGSAGTE
jgi:hypothetical protein